MTLEPSGVALLIAELCLSRCLYILKINNMKIFGAFLARIAVRLKRFDIAD